MKLIKKIVVAVLAWEARLIVRKYKPFIVAVTGSVGKTSTKDAIYEVLKNRSKYVRKSEKSMNSEFGLPLTLIGVPNAWRNPTGWLKNIMAGLGLLIRRHEYPDCLILEIGADHPGDIKNVVSWLRPDIAVITKVSATPVHVEFFKSPEEVFEEKASLAEGIKKGGRIVLFADDAKVMSIAGRPGIKGESFVTFGLTANATARGSAYAVSYSGSRPTGFSFEISVGATSHKLSFTGMIGEAYQYPLLAAAAVGVARSIPFEQIVKSLESYEAPKGRMNLIAGINGSTLIDDTYNSSPDAASSALETLKMLSTKNKVAILGDMMELGKYSAEEHRKIGRAATAIVSRLVTVGQRSRGTADEAEKAGLSENSVETFDTAHEAALQAPAWAAPDSVVLVKGSQSVRMEYVVKALMAEPEKASALLVWQEREWLDKK